MNNSYYYNHQEEQLAIQNLRYDYYKIFEKERIYNNNKKSYYKTFKCDKCNKEINQGTKYYHIINNCGVKSIKNRNKQLLLITKHEGTIDI